MKKLGITLSNGFKIKPVVIDCALGTRGYGPPGPFGMTIKNNKINRKDSTTILKSITRYPEEGNFGAPIYLPRGWSMSEYGFPLPRMFCYTPLPGGNTVNSVALTNDGFDKFTQTEKFATEYIIPSIFIKFGQGTKSEIEKAKEEARYMGHMLKKRFPKKNVILAAVILNISCPNDNQTILKLMDEIVEVVGIFKYHLGDIPLGVKYSYMQDISLAKKLSEKVDIEFHQAINTIPYRVVYGNDKFSPLSHIGNGGVSGPIIKQKAQGYCAKLRCALGPDVNIIGGGGISSIDDAEERFKYANSIAMGILVNRDTQKANDIIDYFSW